LVFLCADYDYDSVKIIKLTTKIVYVLMYTYKKIRSSSHATTVPGTRFRTDPWPKAPGAEQGQKRDSKVSFQSRATKKY
jgi:hypothetical protein